MLLRMAEQQAGKSGPKAVDKYLAFDLWLFKVVELGQFQLVFERLLGTMAFL